MTSLPQSGCFRCNSLFNKNDCAFQNKIDQSALIAL